MAVEPLGTTALTLDLKSPRTRVAPPDPISSLNTPLIGDYELLALVGRGGMGIVYKARHRTLNRVVALKVTQMSHLDSTEAAQRFQREAAAIARLDHPQIIPIYEIGEAFGQQFYSMAFVEGTSLAQLVDLSPLPPRRAAELMQPVAAAIAYAHTQGVVHRDLKPENILVDAAGRPRITDFGIAKCSDTDSLLTQAGDVIGTPSYMPPEQARGQTESIGPLSDVYSLGATLYCLLTGHPPFQAATPLDTMSQVVEREPVSPRRLNPAVDGDLETICLKCLQKAPERRYPSATALAEDLQRFLDCRAILARPVSAYEKAGRWCRRNPFIAASLTGFVAVFLTAFALVSWSYWRTEQALRDEAQQRAAANEARDNAEAHEQAERWERYRANMTATASAFQSLNVSVAQQSLEAAPVQHRNWEWRHYQTRLDQSRQVLSRSDGPVGALRFTGNDRILGFDGKLTVWDLHAGKVVRMLDDLTRVPVLCMEVDARNRLLAYLNGVGELILWDLVADRRQAVPEECKTPLVWVQFSSNAQQIIACTIDHQVHVWDTSDTTGASHHTWSIPAGPNEELGYKTGGRFLMAHNHTNDSVGVWEFQSGRKVAMLDGGAPVSVMGVAFNHQGTRLATSDHFPSNVVRLWDPETGKQLALLSGHANEVRNLRFSPNDERLVSGSFDQTLRLWDGRTGAPLATLRGHSGWVNALAFSPDSHRLVSGSQDHTVRLWDVDRGEPIGVLCGHAAEIRAVEYSPDGSLIASGSLDQTVRVWDARLAERNGILHGHTSFVYGVAFHPDGEQVASGAWDGTIRLWNATSGQETAAWSYPGKAPVYSVAFDSRGELLATLGRDDAVRLWDVKTGREVHHWKIPTNHWQDGRLAFSPRGDLLAAAGCAGNVYVWDTHTREPWAVLRGHVDSVHDVAFSPDGRWLASSGADADRTIRIWDLAKKEAFQVLEGHDDGVLALAFSRDGKLVASGSKDGTVRLWDTATWKQVALLKHGTTIYAVAFSPDDTRLVTGCADNSIRLWDVATGQAVSELRGHESYVKALAFSPDGTRLASASGDFTVRVWDTLSARERGARVKREEGR